MRKCQICKEKLDWDSSMGGDKFLICKECTNKLVKRFGIGNFESVIFALHDIRIQKQKEDKMRR